MALELSMDAVRSFGAGPHHLCPLCYDGAAKYCAGSDAALQYDPGGPVHTVLCVKWLIRVSSNASDVHGLAVPGSNSESTPAIAD